MKLLELADIKGADTGAPSSNCSRLRVTLFNVRLGLHRRHIDRDATRTVFRNLLAELDEDAREGVDLHVDWAYAKLAKTLATDGPGLFFSRSERLSEYVDQRPLTFQPSWAFKFWLDDSAHESRNREHTAADVITLIGMFKEPSHRRPGAKVGRSGEVLWLTPIVGEVREVVDKALQCRHEGGARALESEHYAQRLRDLLGLERRVHPERAVILVAEETIGELQETAARAADNRQASRRTLCAPTLFDAGDYPRYRHWPYHAKAREPDYGRTWDLAVGAHAQRGCGAPELVSEPISVEAFSRMESLGPIHSPPPRVETQRMEDQAFADAICGTATIASLSRALSARLGL